MHALSDFLAAIGACDRAKSKIQSITEITVTFQFQTFFASFSFFVPSWPFSHFRVRLLILCIRSRYTRILYHWVPLPCVRIRLPWIVVSPQLRTWLPSSSSSPKHLVNQHRHIFLTLLFRRPKTYCLRIINWLFFSNLVAGYRAHRKLRHTLVAIVPGPRYTYLGRRPPIPTRPSTLLYYYCLEKTRIVTFFSLQRTAEKPKPILDFVLRLIRHCMS